MDSRDLLSPGDDRSKKYIPVHLSVPALSVKPGDSYRDLVQAASVKVGVEPCDVQLFRMEHVVSDTHSIRPGAYCVVVNDNQLSLQFLQFLATQNRSLIKNFNSTLDVLRSTQAELQREREKGARVDQAITAELDRGNQKQEGLSWTGGYMDGCNPSMPGECPECGDTTTVTVLNLKCTDDCQFGDMGMLEVHQCPNHPDIFVMEYNE
ncbi:hypothetical protein KIPB_000093 [Kipferlia bialata]|uniref:Uncharacterized protein n=1 Tax=Kipferlia bialata TaxID=797122 RepID=A0A9K3CNP4_9EUKA|nr:hypothetical protein KIPB_000093 [Kipferlia bialata]|eukprot:g93.t1